MEDSCTIVQHLNISPLCVPGLSPQSFFGVFDGHGGSDASHYISQNLHVNVAGGLLTSSADILKVFESLTSALVDQLRDGDHHEVWTAVDEIVLKTLKTTFLKTDQDFLTSSMNIQHGSTATTALVLGPRLYASNVGDSRVLLCRSVILEPSVYDWLVTEKIFQKVSTVFVDAGS